MVTPVKTRTNESEAPDTPGVLPADPFSPGGKGAGHYKGLTDQEHQRLRELRGELNRAATADASLIGTPALRRFVNDATLCRYLRARKWNVRKAFKMLKASLVWREKTKPEEIKWEDVSAEGATGKQYVAGKDNQGRSVMVMRPGRENTNEHAGNIRYLIYTLERALWQDDADEKPPLGAQVEHHAEKLVILIDFTGWTLSTAPPMKTSRETLNILQDHYPERLAVAVCYNPPWIFAVFWKAISPFIDPPTYRKIRFVNPKRAKEVSRMKQIFDMKHIDSDLGGEKDPTFDAAAFGAEAKKYDKQRAAVLAKAA